MQWSDSAATVSAAFAQRKRKMSSVETLALFLLQETVSSVACLCMLLLQKPACRTSF